MLADPHQCCCASYSCGPGKTGEDRGKGKLDAASIRLRDELRYCSLENDESAFLAFRHGLECEPLFS